MALGASPMKAKMTKPYTRIDPEDSQLFESSTVREEYKRANPHLFLRHRDICAREVNQHFSDGRQGHSVRLVKAPGKVAFTNK